MLGAKRLADVHPAGQIALLATAFLLLALPGPPWLGLVAALVVVALAACWPTTAVGMAPLTFPFTFYPRDFGSQAIAPAEAAVLLLVTATGLRMFFACIRDPRRCLAMAYVAPPPRWAWAPAIALLVVATLSLWTVADRTYLRESLREYRTVIVVPLVYGALAWWWLRRPRDGWLALTALGLAGALVSLLGAAQLALGVAGVSAEGVRRAISVYRHPNNLALFAGRAAGASFGVGLAWPSPIVRRLALGLAAGAAVGVAVSFSRGSWFALLGTVVLLALLSGRRWLALAACGLALLLLIGLPLTGVDRLARLLDSEAGSGALRLDVWRSTLAMLADYPLTGVGLDQFLYQYQRRYVAPEAWGERFTAHPHNLFLDFWVRLGILGLAVGIVLFATALSAAVRLARSLSGSRRAVSLAAAGSTAYALLHGLVDNGYFLPDLALTFWLSMAVLARVARPAEPDDSVPP